jgi:FixH.
MNWGYKIIIVYVVFIAGIMFMVFKSSSQKVDLVTSDYYGKELKYQQKLDAMNRVSQLSGNVEYNLKDGKLSILFPNDFAGKKIEGEVLLYCPADEDKDVKHNFSVEDAPVFVPIHEGNKGAYDLQVDWKADGISYYFEKKL